MKPEIETLTQLGTAAVQSAITEYTQWFVVSAICWMLFGGVLIAAAGWIWRMAIAEEDYEVRMILGGVAIVCALAGALTIPCNVPDLLSPRAYAIHQLITDARGK